MKSLHKAKQTTQRLLNITKRPIFFKSLLKTCSLLRNHSVKELASMFLEVCVHLYTLWRLMCPSKDVVAFSNDRVIICVFYVLI